MKARMRKIHQLNFTVNVHKRDIEGGKCGVTSKCMEKVAIERTLRDLDPKGGDHHVRIDGGAITFNYHGHKYRAMTPKIPKMALIAFDKERKARAKAEKQGLKFESKVQPHGFKVAAIRGKKIETLTRERQEQINIARRRRIASGRPDKKTYDLRYRVEGLGTV